MIVGLCSSYLEGPLVQGAMQSLLQACDRVVVFEGPAGAPLEEDVPESDFTPWANLGWDQRQPEIKHGRWRTDAHKRTAMIESLRPFTEPTWGVWIDGDEVLCDPQYLRDWLNFADWKEEESGVKNLGWPLKIVEMDGSISVCQAKVLRVDRLDSYSVSSSVFKDALGQLHGRGNYLAGIDEFGTGEHLRNLGKPDGGYLFHWPPLPCEPYIMHRWRLRHPRRSGLRLSDQETVEIAKAKAEGLGL
jgi:hypothetical protein